MQVKRFKNLVILSLITFSLVKASESVAKDSSDQKNPVLSNFGSSCIIAFWPITGSSTTPDVMTSPFGIRYESADGYDFHEGIDIRARTPMDVHAYTNGTVEEVINDGSQGTNNFVTLKHTDPCGGAVFYTGYHHLSDTNFLEVGNVVSAGIPFVVSGNSGVTFYHLHFAGLVGGTSTRDNAINPMRDDSFDYSNTPPLDIIVTDGNPYDFIDFQVYTPADELDLNEIEVRAFTFGGIELDIFFMDFDTRHGVDARFHCPAQNCENGDEDGKVEGTTVQLGLTINYDLSSENFTADSAFHRVKVDVDYPDGWNYINEIRIRATDTQNQSLEHMVFVDNIYNSRTLNGIIDLVGWESFFYSGEKELHLSNGATLTIQSGSTLNLIDHMNFVIDEGTTLIIESGVTCNFGKDAEIHNFGTFIDNSGQCNWKSGACIIAYDGGVYRNTSSNTFTIDNGAFLAIQGGTFELPNAGTVFESGSYWDIGPGSTIKVQPNRNITFKAGAYIDAVGTSSSPITFTSLDGTPSRSEWGTVYIYSSNNTFEHCIIQGSDWGLKFYGTPSTTSGNVVKNCTLKKNDQAIRAENTELDVYDSTIEDNRHAFVLINNTSSTGGIYLDGNTVRNNDRDGIYSWNSVMDVFNTTFDNNGLGNVSTYHGIWASSSSDIALGGRVWDTSLINTQGLNTIKNSHGAGVYASSSSMVLIGDRFNVPGPFGFTENSPAVPSSTNYRAGNNSVYNNGTVSGTYNNKEVYRAGGTTVQANVNYWGGMPTSSQFYGSVDYANWLWSPPSGTQGPTSSAVTDEDTSIKEAIIAHLREVIAETPDSQKAVDALRVIYSFVRTDWEDKLGERNTIFSYLSCLYKAHQNLKLGETAHQLMIVNKMSTEEYDEAITLAEATSSHFSAEIKRDNLVHLISLYLRSKQISLYYS